MKKFYTAVCVSFVLCVLVFISSFFFLDRQNHDVFFYKIETNGRLTGVSRIDKFTTEEKIIYKSLSEMPCKPLPESSKIKLTFDSKLTFRSLLQESYTNDIPSLTYIESDGASISYMNRHNSEFAILNKRSFKKGAIPFDEFSPVTYLPLIEGYNFKRGRSQLFNTMVCSRPLMPPMKRIVTLTSIKDDYILVDSRRIKAECLILKIRNYPQGTIWISKHDRTMLLAEFPGLHLSIRRAFKPIKAVAEDLQQKIGDVVARDANFKSDSVQLAGTIYAPIEGKVKHPAILFVWGDGPHDRNCEGIFSSLAHFMTKAGFVTMRFDKRGVGASGGNASASKDSEISQDIASAIDYLCAQNDVNPDYVSLITFGEGAIYAANSLKLMPGKVKSLVFLSPSTFTLSATDFKENNIDLSATSNNWTDEYVKMILLCSLDTMERINRSSHNWTSIHGWRCFLGKMKESPKNIDLSGVFSAINIPVLVIEGKNTASETGDFGNFIDTTLKSSGNTNHNLVYFGYLDRSLGNEFIDNVHRATYNIDTNVAEAIVNWLGTPSSEKDKKE